MRDFFSDLVGDCEYCGRNTFESIIRLIKEETIECELCISRFKKFEQYWQDLTNSKDEIKKIADSESAVSMLRKIFYSYSHKGIHKPLILPGALKIEVTKRCNLQCQHCLADSGPETYNELSLKQIKQLLIDAKGIGVNAVGLVGGEPLLRKDLSDIIDFICELGMNYSISTNGMLMSENIINKINRRNLVKVSVSIDGNQLYHNRMRRNDFAYQQALKGVEQLVNAGIKVAIAMVVTTQNIHLIRHVIETSIDVGASFFVINDLIPTGRGEQIKELCIPYNDYREMTKLMMKYRDYYKKDINILWKGMVPEGSKDCDMGQFIVSKCGAALTELTIDNEGKVLPCPFLPTTNESILERSIKSIWFDSEELAVYQNRNELQGACGSCGRSFNCSGCRARALAHTGEIYGADVRCPLSHK